MTQQGVGRETVWQSPTNFWIFTALLLLGPLPFLVKLCRFLWEREQYQFFPLMIAGAVLLAVERWQDLPRKSSLRPGSVGVEIALLLAAMGLLVAAAVLWVQALAGAAVILILAAVAWRFGAWRMVRAMGPSLVLLFTILPPPGGGDQRATLSLQQMAIRICSRLLDGLHVPHVRAGNVLEIPGRRLLVEQACSGINSLMAVLAFTLLYGFWKRRSIWRIVLLLPAAVFFVICGNVARITGEAWLKVTFNVDLLEGTRHQVMGLLLFVGCVGLVISFDVLLGVLGDLVGKRDSARAMVAEATSAGDPVKIVRTEWAIALVFAISGFYFESHVWNAWAVPTVQAHAHFDLPAKLGDWEKINKTAMLVERPQTEASTSFVWQYHFGDLVASVAIDYPFTGYHELSYCYSSSGWNLLSQATVSDSSGDFQQTEMEKSPDQAGYLLFNQTDERGQSVAYVPSFSGSSMRDRFNTYRSIALGGATYQFQVMAQQYSGLSNLQREQTKALYLQARQLLMQQLQAQLERK